MYLTHFKSKQLSIASLYLIILGLHFSPFMQKNEPSFCEIMVNV